MSNHRDQSVLPSPSGPVLCATGCGFFGNPNTDNLCSKCNADRKRQQASSSPAITPTITSTSTSTSSSSSPAITPSPSTPSLAPLAITDSPTTVTSTSTSTAPIITLDTATSSPAVISPSPSTSTSSTEAPTTTPKKKLNRCGVCSKKVGITYFNCRCDDSLLLCASHRLPHQHDCKFDIKKLHAANLTKANPEIIRAKMEKI